MTLGPFDPPTREYPVGGSGSVEFCPDCYPMLQVVPPYSTLNAVFGLHDGHYRRGFYNSRNIEIWEHEQQLPFVEEAYELPGVPGLLLREFVSEGERLVVCRRNGHTTPLIRLRYAPAAAVVVVNGDRK